MEKNHKENLSFNGLGISSRILEILEKLHYTTPTPIQYQSIPEALEGKDLIGIAQTGTGKTLAFGIPMIQHLGKSDGIGLVIAPTRELAIQIDEHFRQIGKWLGLTTAVLIGGQAMGKQVADVKRNPHVIIATPGRLIDHLQHKTVDLGKVEILVLDEADRMFDMGFAPQLRTILEKVPKNRQTLLFSATMPAAIVTIATLHMELPIRVEVAPPGTVAENVEQEIIIARKEERPELLYKILSEHKGKILIFSRTKHGAKKITMAIKLKGYSAAEIHSNRSLGQRRQALEGFKSGKYKALVATDIAAPGIDIQNIELVINYDLPDNPEDYVHRIGRTGRAGHEGKAISFAAPEQRRDIQIIERIIRKTLRVSYLKGMPAPSQPHEQIRRIEQRPPRPYRNRRFAARGQGRRRR
jgi:ATP-dependent RNA helicase RhlE